METLQALQDEAATIKARIDILRATTGDDRLLAQKELDSLEGNYRLLLNSIATVSNARGTPSPTHELERLDERGDVIRAGQPNENARVVKLRDPKTGTVTDWPDPSTTVKATPSPINALEPIKDPNNPNRIIKMRDPATGTVIDVPDVAAGSKPTVVQGPRGEMFSWDGAKLTQLQPGTPEKPQVVQGQGGAIYSWDGKTLSQLQAGKPQPTENQDRPNVKDGYHVTETYIGGDWVVTKYGEKAKPGEPTEGMERPNTKEGYKVTERFSGGDWTVVDVGARATPREPTTLSAPADQQFIVRTDAQGNPVNIENPNYRPKTQGDIAARVGQLQSLANTKKEEVMKKVSGTFTADQALSEFNTWWDQNVQPQTAVLQAAAEEVNFARGKEVAEQRRLAQTAAQAAGTQAINQYNASSGEALDPEFGKLLAGVQAGKVPTDVDYSKMWTGSGLADKVKQATAEALKYIDPTAAQLTGGPAPTWQATNPADALNRTIYTQGGFGGGQPPPAPAPVTPAAVSTGDQFTAPWQRADQSTGITPAGDAMAPTPGLTGTVAPDDPRFLGTSAAALQLQQDQAAQEAQVAADLDALRNQMAESDVYQYGGGQPAPAPVPVRRRPTVVNQDPFAQQALAAGLGAGGLGPTAPIPFYQQALAAGLGQGGLNPSRWVPPQYEYLGGPTPY